MLLSTDTAYPGHLYAYSDDTDLATYVQSMEMLAELAPSLTIVLPSHNSDTMSPDLLPKMRDALVEVAAGGREPDRLDDLRAIYDYDGFGVYGPLPEERR